MYMYVNNVHDKLSPTIIILFTSLIFFNVLELNLMYFLFRMLEERAIINSSVCSSSNNSISSSIVISVYSSKSYVYNTFYTQNWRYSENCARSVILW